MRPGEQIYFPPLKSFQITETDTLLKKSKYATRCSINSSTFFKIKAIVINCASFSEKSKTLYNQLTTLQNIFLLSQGENTFPLLSLFIPSTEREDDMKNTKIVCGWVALHRSKVKKKFLIKNTKNPIFVANDGLVVFGGTGWGELPPRDQRSKIKNTSYSTSTKI